MLTEPELGKIRELVTGIVASKNEGCIYFGICINRLKIAEIEEEIARLVSADGMAVEPLELATRTSGVDRPQIEIHIPNLPQYLETLVTERGKAAPYMLYLIHELSSVIEEQTQGDREISCPFVQFLNYRREVFRDLHICAVFWLDRQAVGYLSEHAPDFWSFRSKTLEFPPETEPESARTAKRETAASEANLPYLGQQAIEERLKEVEKQIAIYRSASPPDQNAIAELLLEAGGLYFRRHDIQDALRLLFEAQRIFATLKLQVQQRNCHIWIATAFNVLGQLDKAEEPLRQAVTIDGSLNNESNLAVDYNDLSQIYDARGELAEAEVWLRKAIAIDERLGDQPNLAIDYNNLSQIYDARGELGEAEVWLRKAIAIDERLADEPKLAIRYNNLSQIYQDRGELGEAEVWLRKAISIAEKLQDRVKLGLLYGNFSRLLVQQKRRNESEQYAEKAREIRDALANK